MRTLQEVAKVYNYNSFKGFSLTELLKFIPQDKLKLFSIELNRNNIHKKILEFNSKNITEEMKENVKIGFNSALKRDGLNALIAYENVKMFAWILEDNDGNWNDENYKYFGLPLFKSIAVKYKFENPIKNDIGNEYKYR